MSVRKVVKIDKEKCNGCGLCVPACAEGAIQIIDGKARLVSEMYCDGLGACLGECPKDAITIEEREAEDFDQAAVEKHIAKMKLNPEAQAEEKPISPHSGCPGSRLLELQKSKKTSTNVDNKSLELNSELNHWPIKLKLVPPVAPFLKDADLMLIADCVPFAYPDIHRKFLSNSSVVIGCPKFDDYELYIDRLSSILKESNVKSLTVVHMEVPCCFGFWQLGQQAIKASGKDIPLYQAIIGLGGEIKNTNMPKFEEGGKEEYTGEG